MAIKDTQCMIFQGRWLWDWSLSEDCKIYGKTIVKETDSTKFGCVEIQSQESKGDGG